MRKRKKDKDTHRYKQVDKSRIKRQGNVSERLSQELSGKAKRQTLNKWNTGHSKRKVFMEKQLNQ